MDKGEGHLGIGKVNAECSVLDAVKQAVNSPLLDTTIEGAENILINTSGKVDILSINTAINYVRELAGDKVNIIWGTVTAENFDAEKIVVTLVATGMSKHKKIASKTTIETVGLNKGQEHKRTVEPKKIPSGMPVMKPVTPTLKEKELLIPDFLLEAGKRK